MTKNSPKISVIIPVYNDASGLKDTLQSLVAQDYPKEDFEIIVADNGSTDNTLEIAKEFEKEYPKIIKIVIEDKIQSSYAARNKGILQASGEIISFIDANMIVGESYIFDVVKVMEDKKIDYLGCNVEIFANKKNIFSKYNQASGFPIKKDIEKCHFTPTCCLTVNKSVLDEIGLFDKRLISGGDFEFGKRVYNYKKYKIHYEPSITVKHPARSSLKGLLKKSFRIGRGSAQLMIYYPNEYSHINRLLFHFFAFFPPSPKSFQGLFRNIAWKDCSISEKIFFYKIKWATKITKHLGYIYESLFHRFYTNI